MTDGADRPAERPVRGDLAAEQLTPQVLAHSRRVSAGQDQAVERVGLDVRPRDRRAELRVGLQLRVELLWFSGRAELPEDHAVEQPRVGGRRGATVLRRESNDMAGARQQPPRHRDLGDVEVAVGQGDQNGCDRPTLGETIRRRASSTS